MTLVCNIAFIDFDHTLYNTHQFAEDIKAIFAEAGIEGERYKKIMEIAVRGESGTYYNYSFERHAELAKKEYPNLDTTKILMQLHNLDNNNYQDAEAEQFLQYIKQHSQKIILLTAGDKKFQHQKINTTNLAHYFDDIITCHEKKYQHINEQTKINNSALLINDNMRENEEVAQHCPSCTIIGRKHPVKYSEQEYNQSSIPYFATLSDIQAYLTTQ